VTYDINVFARQTGSGDYAANASWRALRAARVGAPIVLPWHQALVMQGVVFGAQAGSITTPVAGHASITAAQPELAAYFATGVAIVPLSGRMSMETGATTLAQGGMLLAFSNINVGAGTSTAASVVNLNQLAPTATAGAAGAAYTGNGTDPLTAGNYLDLARVSAVVDADAATSGIVPPSLSWSAMNDIIPIMGQACSFLAYGEAAANTVFATLIWAELPEGQFTS
jgi:hypothetical protein